MLQPPYGNVASIVSGATPSSSTWKATAGGFGTAFASVSMAGAPYDCENDADITVCPTTISVGKATVYTLSQNNYLSQYSTGMGMDQLMSVGPTGSGQNLDGAQLTESISVKQGTTNTCPATVDPCKPFSSCPAKINYRQGASAVFTVGQDGVDAYGNPIAATANAFCDQHFFTENYDLLGRLG